MNLCFPASFRSRFALAVALLSGVFAQDAFAASAKWKTNPSGNDWLSPANWSPMAVPNDITDVATFGSTTKSGVSISDTVQVSEIDFLADASQYTISPASYLYLANGGINNASGKVQSFVVGADPLGNASIIVFQNGSVAGSLTQFTTVGAMSEGNTGGYVEFDDQSSSESATFVTDGSQATGGGGGLINFFGNSNAADASFMTNGPFIIGGGAGHVQFFDSASSGNGSFQNSGGLASGAPGGILSFYSDSTAASSTVVNAGPASVADGGSGLTFFFERSNAGSARLSALGAMITGAIGGEIDFFDTSSAAASAITIGSGTVFDGQGGVALFYENSTAGTSTIVLNGETTLAGFSGYLYFRDDSTADHATITLQGDTISSSPLLGPTAIFSERATAGEALFTCEGGKVSGGSGGAMVFESNSSAGNATLIAEDGAAVEAEGGSIFFYERSTGETARLELFGNGKLDLSVHKKVGLPIGSIEGNGLVFLGSTELAVGSNNLSTAFAGSIQDGGIEGGKHGSLRKIGLGTLTLTGANLYSGGTVIEDGTLVLAAKKGSATGKGLLQVIGGILAGTGGIRGSVVVGSGTGAELSPGSNGVGTLSTQGSLTFDADGQYDCDVDLRKAKSDAVSANGVSLNGEISLVALRSGSLPTGTVLFVINNTSAQPIVGTFANLPDGSVVSLAGNNLQANYEGGDGNDLTLTVVP